MMLNLLRILSYPSVSKKELNQLPKESGIYYYTCLFKVLYVGQSTSVYHRWNHQGDWKHKHRDSFLKSRFARLHYRKVKAQNLDLIEALEIQRFNPPLNIQKPNAAKYRRKVNGLIEDVCWIVGIAVLGLIVIGLFSR